MNAYPSAEITPAMDETRPKIEPNMASDPALCEKVARHIHREFAFPQFLQQQRLHETWQRIDDAFRVRGKRSDLDISYTDAASRNKNPDGRGDGLTDRNDGISAKVYPAAFHKQVRSKTDMHMSLAYADGNLPVRAMKPETIYEHPLYNPTEQGVDAANELLRQCADAVQLKTRDRQVRGSWSKVGHAWVHCDWHMRLVDVPVSYAIPPDQQRAMAMIQQVSQMFGGQPPQPGAGPNGEPAAVWMKRTVDPDSMVTDFVPLRYDAVYIDQTLPADDMDRQMCPIICSHINRTSLFGNDYEPQLNPFGWLNKNKALADGQEQYALTDQMETNFRMELQKKHGLDGLSVTKARNQLKQLWTCYPMLAIDPATGMLDEGEGVQCPTCRGAMEVSTPVGMDENGAAAPPSKGPCPQCQGVGKIFIEPKRYVVQMFGILSAGASRCTVLRIQRNPTVKDQVPLFFGAHLAEDTTGAIPMSVAEAALSACDQLATAHNQVLDAKNQLINRQWIMGADEPAMQMDCNRPNRNIPREGPPGSVGPAPTVAFDITTNLTGQFIPMQQNEVVEIIGLPPVLLGSISAGRRAATEIDTASNAAKMPITVEVDSCNHQIIGKWAQMHLDNLEAWADRDWILKRTGRTTFGRIKLFTAVGQEFFAKQAQLQFGQYILQASVNDPSIDRAKVWGGILKLAGFPDSSEIVNDGGLRKAQMDGFKIIAQILGEGRPVQPTMSDPDEVYIAMFQEALKDEEWMQRVPENMPLLQQRLQIQQTIQQEKQLMQMQQQAAQQTLMAPPDGKLPNNGQKPANGNRVAGNETQSKQQLAGARGGNN